MQVKFIPFIHNDRKWSKVIERSCGVKTTIFLKCVLSFSSLGMKGLKTEENIGSASTKMVKMVKSYFSTNRCKEKYQLIKKQGKYFF